MIQIACGSFFIEQQAFERVRQKLLSDRHDARLDTVLGRWVRPTDRSLPLAFLGRTLHELVLTPFEELKQTRGVGSKKISCLIDLLERAVGWEAEMRENTLPAAKPRDAGIEVPAATDGSPTDLIWDQWRATVAANGLSSLTLGRLAGSLRDLPRPMWHTPLGSYVNLTLEEMTRLHTHGERRLSAIFLIFRNLYELLEGASAAHLCATVELKFARQLDTWTARWLNSPKSPELEDVHLGFVTPIVEQLRIDAGDSLAEMAVACIGASHPGPRLLEMRPSQPGFSQNWYYMDKMQAIIAARWGGGAARMDELVAGLRARHGRSQGVDLLRVSAGTFFGPACNQVLAASSG